MKELLDKIIEKYGELKLEAALMILFVCVFLVLNGPEIAQEAVALYQTEDVSGADREDPPGDEALASGESETEEASESASDADRETEDGDAPDHEDGERAGGMSGDEREDDGESESDQKGEAESENTAGDAQDEKEEVGEAGAEEESSAADGDILETLSSEELARRIRKALAAMPEGFVIPMAASEPEPVGVFPVLGFGEGRKLYGYRLLIGQEQQTEHDEKERKSMTLLKTMIETRLEDYDGTWSVYVKNLTEDEGFVVNDQPMKSASVMKLFIMGTVYKAFESGELERTEEVMSLVNNMITVSDNEASNQLLYLLGESSYEQGIQMVDEFIEEYGFSEMTVEYNGFNNSATNTGTGNYNQVSAKDCGKLLEDIYRRTWVSRTVSNEMESMLLNQQTRYKIPAGLPEGVLCGNKTGEMDATENDAAIIYAGDCDYILVVLSSDWNSRDDAIYRIKSLSSLVYEFLN